MQKNIHGWVYCKVSYSTSSRIFINEVPTNYIFRNLQKIQPKEQFISGLLNVIQIRNKKFRWFKFRYRKFFYFGQCNSWYTRILNSNCETNLFVSFTLQFVTSMLGSKFQTCRIQWGCSLFQFWSQIPF